MKTYVGVDIGGTKIYAGLITEKGDILRTKRMPTEVVKGNRAILKNVSALIRDIAQGTTIHGIGIGLAGHIDHVQNIVLDAGPNFLPSFRRIPLVPSLFDVFRVPVVLENDANVFALGEAVFGRGKGFRSVIGVTLGTGIGAGIIQDGKLIHGKNNLAGEVGQMFTRDEHCIWEELAAGEAFNHYNDIDRGASFLADGFHNVLHVLDPDIIVVGGGLARVPGLVKKTQRATRTRLHYRALQKTPIVKSTLLSKAPLLGAMLIVRGR